LRYCYFTINTGILDLWW